MATAVASMVTDPAMPGEKVDLDHSQPSYDSGNPLSHEFESECFETRLYREADPRPRPGTPEAKDVDQSAIRHNQRSNASNKVRYTNQERPAHETNSSHRRGTMNSEKSTGSFDPRWVSQNILSLDGGGVRGYSTLLILNKLMEYIREEEINHPTDPATCSFHPKDPPAEVNKPYGNPSETFYPSHYFDYMFGTSTGSLIAILLGRLRLSAQDALHVYRELAPTIFGRRRIWSMRSPLFCPRGKHDHRRLEKAMKAIVDSCSTPVSRPSRQVGGTPYNFDPNFSSEPSMCRTVCVSYLGNTPFLFRSYEHAVPNETSDNQYAGTLEHNPGPAHAIPIWKVGRATSAAPSYFDPMKIDGQKFIDGGFGCNNPSVAAYCEVIQMHNWSPKVINMFLTIGTGEPDFDYDSGNGWTHVLKTLKALPKVVTGAKESHATLANITRAHNVRYYRWNVSKDLGNLKMDKWTLGDGPDSTQRKIEDWTRQYLADEEIQKQLRSVAKDLVSHRRERASTPRWELVATGARYRCMFNHCSSGHHYRNTEQELRRHARQRHPEMDEATVEDIIQKGKML